MRSFSSRSWTTAFVIFGFCTCPRHASVRRPAPTLFSPWRRFIRLTVSEVCVSGNSRSSICVLLTKSQLLNEHPVGVLAGEKELRCKATRTELAPKRGVHVNKRSCELAVNWSGWLRQMAGIPTRLRLFGEAQWLGLPPRHCPQPYLSILSDSIPILFPFYLRSVTILQPF